MYTLRRIWLDYYEVAGEGHALVLNHGGLAIDFRLQYPEMVDALITVGAGLSGYEEDDPEELMAKFEAMDEAFKSGNIAQSVDISLQIWIDKNKSL